MSGQLYRISVELGYQVNFPQGNAYNNTDGISTLSLVKNFRSWQSPALRVSYNLSKTRSVGIYTEISKLDNWGSSASDLYDNAKAKFKAAGIFYKYEPRKIPLLGKFKAGLSIGAMYGTYNILVTQMVYDTDYIPGPSDFPFDEMGKIAGVISDLTIGYPFTSNMKINFNLGFKYLFMNSLLCTDKTTFVITPEIGISFNFLKNKTFYIY